MQSVCQATVVGGFSKGNGTRHAPAEHPIRCVSVHSEAATGCTAGRHAEALAARVARWATLGTAKKISSATRPLVEQLVKRASTSTVLPDFGILRQSASVHMHCSLHGHPAGMTLESASCQLPSKCLMICQTSAIHN